MNAVGLPVPHILDQSIDCSPAYHCGPPGIMRHSSRDSSKLAAIDVAMGIIYLSQTVVGALGNSSLLLRYLVLYFTGCRVRYTDMILQHLFVANLLSLLCRGVPQTVESFGVKDFHSDIGCKLLFYVHRVGRGVSLVSTCLLSIFQVIKISPGDSRWADLKVKSPKYIGSSMSLSWILYMLINTFNLIYITGKWSNTSVTNIKDVGYCSATHPDTTTVSFLAAFLTFPDAVCVGLMLWSSSSMVLILHRHKQRMMHIHKASTHRSSPESRATKTILALVSTFVSFYTLSSIFQCWMTLISNPKWFVVHMGAIVTGCFPAVSPFLLLSPDSRFCFAWKQN
ncbi:vomeronasal type-1 receptor 4-like [Sciurus carolinensis]|uniref:vomeronasal type-1 receptor 4-like n=1 Tax=Sciurus carolinensis TaxID=30640 RepID=UPI001FB43555|nr:vomeronasal type-1 receptor 4-like [Sciurus carolinensis]